MDSIKSHFKVLDDQNKLPPDWVKKISTTDLIPYYYNKKTHESTWDNPRLLIDKEYNETHNIVKKKEGGRKTRKMRKTRNKKKHKKSKTRKTRNKKKHKKSKTRKK